MGWYSILPAHLTVYETWIIRAFLLLSILNLLPWVLAFIYDILYYISRQIWHEVPVWGGRARGQRRPRAPTLRGRDRRMSFRDIVTGGGPTTAGDEYVQDDQDDDNDDNNDSSTQLQVTPSSRQKARKQGEGMGVRRRTAGGVGHRKTLSSQSIEEEEEEEQEEGEEETDDDNGDT